MEREESICHPLSAWHDIKNGTEKGMETEDVARPANFSVFAGEFESKPKTARDRLIFEPHVRLIRGSRA